MRLAQRGRKSSKETSSSSESDGVAQRMTLIVARVMTYDVRSSGDNDVDLSTIAVAQQLCTWTQRWS
jgi:hypothetical protein